MRHSIACVTSAGVLPQPSGRRLLAASVLAAAAAVLTAVAISAPLPAAQAAWGGGALAAWCGALLYTCATAAHWDGAGLAQWKLGPWFLAYCLVIDGLASIIWAHPQTGSYVIILASSVARSEWLTAVALTAWAAGYIAAPRRVLASRGQRFMARLAARRPATAIGPVVPWLLYGAGTAARLARYLQTGDLGNIGSPASVLGSPAWYQQALADVTLACPLAILIAGLRVFRDRGCGARFTLAVLLAAEITAALITGQKGMFVTAVAAAAIARASAGRRVPVAALTAATAFALLFLIPFTSAYRATAHPAGAPALTPAQAAAAAPSLGRAVAAAVSPSAVPVSVAYLAQRLSDISGPALVMQETPSQVPYAGDARLPETVAADWVPRVLWPGKPAGAEGINFTSDYYGSDLATATAITPQGDLYHYGGWLTVITGMAVLGWLVRTADEVLDVRDPRAALLVLLLWPVLADAEGTVTVMLAVLPGLVLTWLAVTSAVFRRRRAPVPAPLPLR